jgi:signal transduction histidine kinase
MLTAAFIALNEASEDLPPRASERLNAVRGHLVAVEEQLRHFAHELHPRLLEERGFTAAVEFLAHGFTSRHSVAADVRVKIPDRFPEPIASALYRVVQEGLTNVGRHAHAT